MAAPATVMQSMNGATSRNTRAATCTARKPYRSPEPRARNVPRSPVRKGRGPTAAATAVARARISRQGAKEFWKWLDAASRRFAKVLSCDARRALTARFSREDARRGCPTPPPLVFFWRLSQCRAVKARRALSRNDPADHPNARVEPTQKFLHALAAKSRLVSSRLVSASPPRTTRPRELGTAPTGTPARDGRARSRTRSCRGGGRGRGGACSCRASRRVGRRGKCRSSLG